MSCCEPQLGWLGAMDPGTAAAQVLTSANAKKFGGKIVADSARAGQMLDVAGVPAYIPGTGDCSAVSGSGMLKPALMTSAGGMVLKFAPKAFAVNPIVGGVVVAIGSLLEVFGAIFAHHAAAVKKEQTVLCVAVPAANHALQIIDEAVQSGQANPQDAINALSSLPSQFEGEVGSIYKDCNAACVMTDELKAICLVKASQYQDLLTGAAQVVTAGGPNASSPTGVIAPASSYASFYGGASPAPATASPSWLPIAAVLLAGFLLARGV